MKVLSLDWRIVFAGLGAALSGQLAVALVIQRRVGGLTGAVRTAYRKRSRKALLIFATDFLGGVVVGGLAAVAGMSQPENVVSFIDSHPQIGWSLLGLLGPVTSARFLFGSATIGRIEPWARDVAGMPVDRSTSGDPLRALPGLRHEAVESMVAAAWSRVHHDLETHREYLVDAILRNVERVDVQNVLIRAAASFVDKVGDSTNGYVGELLASLVEKNLGEERVTFLETIVDALADAQMWQPLEHVQEFVANLPTAESE